MNTTQTTAADFCNGSYASDYARILEVVTYGTAQDLSITVADLSREAMQSLIAVNEASPTDASALDQSAFVDYYWGMAIEIERQIETDDKE